MGQSNFPSGMAHIANGISQNPKTTALAVALSALLVWAIKDKDARQWLLENNSTTTTQDSTSVATDKIDDETAANVTTLLITPQ